MRKPHIRFTVEAFYRPYVEAELAYQMVKLHRLLKVQGKDLPQYAKVTYDIWMEEIVIEPRWVKEYDDVEMLPEAVVQRVQSLLEKP